MLKCLSVTGLTLSQVLTCAGDAFKIPRTYTSWRRRTLTVTRWPSRTGIRTGTFPPNAAEVPGQVARPVPQGLGLGAGGSPGRAASGRRGGLTSGRAGAALRRSGPEAGAGPAAAGGCGGALHGRGTAAEPGGWGHGSVRRPYKARRSAQVSGPRGRPGPQLPGPEGPPPPRGGALAHGCRVRGRWDGAFRAALGDSAGRASRARPAAGCRGTSVRAAGERGQRSRRSALARRGRGRADAAAGSSEGPSPGQLGPGRAVGVAVPAGRGKGGMVLLQIACAWHRLAYIWTGLNREQHLSVELGIGLNTHSCVEKKACT